MGFYIRKSIKVGPVRFNLSKSGIGISGGIKGFRIGTGPKGNYVHIGRGGIYYRKTFSAGDIASSRSSVHESNENYSVDAIVMQDITSEDVSHMTDSSSAELLHEINEKKQIPRIGPWVLCGSILLMLIIFSALKAFYDNTNGGNNSILFLVFSMFYIISVLGLIVAVFFAFRRDAINKTVVLFYDFDPVLEESYACLHSSALQLANCSNCWHVFASGGVTDRKYHAGASQLVNRKNTSITAVSPPFLQSNIETVAICVGQRILYFFPDRLLVYDASGRVGAIAYEHLKVSVAQKQFIESVAPRDNQIIGQTWQYVNKNGTPDRRFANNPQLSICLYDEISFQSESGLNELIQISQSGIGIAFAQSVQGLASHTKN